MVNVDDIDLIGLVMPSSSEVWTFPKLIKRVQIGGCLAILLT